jgi:uncharacterized ubiquitin-like protein YukD
LQEAFKLTSIDADKQAVLNEIVKKVILYSDDKKTHNHTYEDIDIFAGGNSFDTTPISLKMSSRIGEEFSHNFKLESSYRNRSSASKVKDEREAYTRKLEYNRVKRDEDYIHSTSKFLDSKFKDSKGQGIQGVRLSNSSFSKSVHSSDFKYDESIELSGPNVVRVKIHVFIDDSDQTVIASIDKSRTIRELIQLAVNKLKNQYPSIESSLIQMVHKARILNQENTLTASGIESGMNFDMLVQEKSTPTPNGDSSHAEVVTRKRMSDTESVQQYISRDKLPTLKNPEYTLSPDLIEMARMTEYDIMNVKDLTIENEHGRVKWEGRTDVRSLKFDELVQIAPFAATVYPKEVEEQGLKPEVGHGLNKRSIISLKKIFQGSKDTRTPTAFEESLKNRAETMDECKFISYDRKHGVLKFQVEHFTKYDFSGTYEEEQTVENEESEQEQTNDKIKSIDRAASNNRFSFGPPEPKGYMGGELIEDHDIDAPMGSIPEQDSDEQMDVDNKHRSYRRPFDFLDNIREDSDSQQASVEMHDEDESEENKKEHKVDFGFIHEKQFQREEEYDDQEYEQEESEDGQEIMQASVMTADAIRVRIRQRKQQIQDSLKDFDKMRVTVRERISSKNLVKASYNKGSNNQSLFLKKVSSVNAVLGCAKMSYFNTIDKVYRKSKVNHKNSEFSDSQKRNLINKYMTDHYHNILQSYLKASRIIESENANKEINSSHQKRRQRRANVNLSANNIELPVIDPPEKPYHYSDIWFEILSKSRKVLSPDNIETNEIAQDLLTEIKSIINKDCQSFALLNACYGNSFIDLSNYMANPERLSSKLMDKYRHKIDPKEQSSRYNLLSNWLKYATTEEIRTMIRTNTDLNIYQKASLYLYCDDKYAASELLNMDLPSEIPDRVSKLNNQSAKFNSLAKKDENNPEDCKRLIEFLNGEFAYTTSLSWKCNLGRLIWNNVKLNIHNGLERLDKEVENEAEAGEKVDPKEHDDPLMYEILSIFCRPDVPTTGIFRERGIDHQNSLIRRTMWVVITSLKKLNQHLISEDKESKRSESMNNREMFQNLIDEYYTKITYQFSQELETIGLWQWAIFVVLHLENSSQKTSFVKDLLLKHCEDENFTSFFTEDLKIPRHYINEAKAIHFYSRGEYALSFIQWLNGGFYQKAHNVLISHMIITSESHPQKFADLKIIKKLEKHKEYIENWDTQGKVLFDFLELRNDALGYFNTFFDNFGEFKLTKEEWKMQKSSEDIIKLQNKLARLIKSIDSFGRHEVTCTVTVVKTEIKRMLLDWDTKFKIINAKVNSDKTELEFPDNYLIESEDLTINDKKNALDKFINVTMAEFLSAK